ncbi:hypothetical protein N0V83_006808 [Neocucurbitaria cava]|uniref:Uncharacterized protein n=1 Tax=Neocucurbitaria cava TaxID=798079 RepID=A0A9W8Y5R7_9PLEO|nr:hypothetical protein N0V83_006808 [Neocucurbitaria cava]
MNRGPGIQTMAHRRSKPSISTPLRGDAHTLFALNRTAKHDIQGFISGQYNAVHKIGGHELTNPTGTKFVFYLRLDDGGEVVALGSDTKAALEEYVNGEFELELGVAVPCFGLIRPATTSKLVEDYSADFVDGDGDKALSTVDEVEEDCDTSDVPPATVSTKGVARLADDSDAGRKARLMRSHGTLSLAQVIARADPSGFPFAGGDEADSESASEYGDDGDLEDITRTIEKHFVYQNESNSCTTTALSRDTTIDIAYPRSSAITSDHKSLLKRHDNTVSLARLISAAKDATATDFLNSDYHSGTSLSPSPSPLSSPTSTSSASSSPSPQPRVSYTFATKPCLDSHFPGHTSCHGHEQGSSAGGGGRSAEDAIPSSPLPILTFGRSGDEVEDHLMSSSTFDEDVDGVDKELNASGFYGESEADLAYDAGDRVLDENIIQVSSSPFDETAHEYRATEVDITARIEFFINNNALRRRHDDNDDNDDTDSATQSIHTSTFSDCSSIITPKSSNESVRLAYPRLIDALDLEIANHAMVAVDNKHQRGVSLPVVCAKWTEVDTRDEQEEPQDVAEPGCQLLLSVVVEDHANDPLSSSALVIYHQPGSTASRVEEQPLLSEMEDAAAVAANEQEYARVPSEVALDSGSREEEGWAGKMKSRLKKVPQTAQRTGRRCARSTKKLARTVRYFVPAAVAACKLF